MKEIIQDRKISLANDSDLRKKLNKSANESYKNRLFTIIFTSFLVSFFSNFDIKMWKQFAAREIIKDMIICI